MESNPRRRLFKAYEMRRFVKTMEPHAISSKFDNFTNVDMTRYGFCMKPFCSWRWHSATGAGWKGQSTHPIIGTVVAASREVEH
jgi:hypothetical protein